MQATGAVGASAGAGRDPEHDCGTKIGAGEAEFGAHDGRECRTGAAPGQAGDGLGRLQQGPGPRAAVQV